MSGGTARSRRWQTYSAQELKVGPGGAELEWHVLAAEVRAEVAASSAPARSSPLGTDDGVEVDLSQLDGLAERAPAEAVRVASAFVITELRRLVNERNAEMLTSDPSPHVLVKSAYRAGVITKETGEALRGLLTLLELTDRNPETATVDKAVDFIVLCRAVLYALSRS